MNNTTIATTTAKVPSAARAKRTARERAAREAAKNQQLDKVAAAVHETLETQQRAADAHAEGLKAAEPLCTRAMLASVVIHRWMATLTDKQITKDVAEKHNVTAARLGKYKKNAIDVQNKEFVAVCEAAGELRQTHYKHTLPWGQDGARILTTEAFERYSAAIRHARWKFDVAADAFASVYPTLIEAAKAELKEAFNESDYPRHVRSKFGVDLQIMPLPDSTDFRVNLSADVVWDIKRNITEALHRTVNEAMQAPYARLHELVDRMARRLSVVPELRKRGTPYTGATGTFRDSLVEGLAELIEIMPGLNLTKDAKLDELCESAKQMIAGVTPELLRNDMTKRAEVAKRATEIADVMAGYMGAAS